MVDDKIKYSTAFTAGALLLRETEAFVAEIKDYDAFLDGSENIDFSVIPVNAESSKKRLKHEIEKRLFAINNGNLLNQFLTSDKSGKNTILFYGICKCYPIIRHFMLEGVLNKWKNLDFELEINDFSNFIYRKMDFHPELAKITDKTVYKCGQVVLKMLKDLGMLNKNKLQKIAINNAVLGNIISTGDSWFLDVILLSESEKQGI
ncbi:BrxA family protein [Flavobacterium urumqiense]|uniref:Putative inner membrane protein n=1 Tax=Flavobacterium urumqiense TaxID=935224 RepID=A0A1H5VFY1_9FLAO|nr:BrxA family protein [Flavobacterium urumqiense]SEF86173.1 Putative inner membrane protein [Flavobacterium urumqiense]